MSRYFYILSGTLLLFALILVALSLAPSSYQAGLPVSGSLGRTGALLLLLASLGAAQRRGAAA
jgi:hypothetical protein